MKHKNEPENLPMRIMWFETDFERIALSSDTHLELHTEVLPWKKMLDGSTRPCHYFMCETLNEGTWHRVLFHSHGGGISRAWICL